MVIGNEKAALFSPSDHLVYTFGGIFALEIGQSIVKIHLVAQLGGIAPQIFGAVAANGFGNILIECNKADMAGFAVLIGIITFRPFYLSMVR